MPSRFRDFLSGVRAELPLLIGGVPFGMICGVLAIDAGIPPLQAQAMSAIVFAGSSQFVLTQLVHNSAPAVIMVLTVAVINLRHALYSASVARYVQHLHPAWKWLLAYLLTDEAYAVTIIYYQKSIAQVEGTSHRGNSQSEIMHPPAEDTRHWFFLGSGLTLWTFWQLSTAAGIFLGAVIPSNWPLDFTLALTFIALVVPSLKDRASLAAAISAGVVAVLTFSMPYKLNLLTAALVGIVVGILVERGS